MRNKQENNIKILKWEIPVLESFESVNSLECAPCMGSGSSAGTKCTTGGSANKKCAAGGNAGGRCATGGNAGAQCVQGGSTIFS